LVDGTGGRQNRSTTGDHDRPEFLIVRVSKLPTRRESALRPLLVIVGSAGLIIGWIELYRHVYP
jgi:hypothetical protein